MMEQEDLLYDPRFLEAHAGSIITDPATAIVELVANCWDAYATDVQITWPDSSQGRQFKIKDNGKGMTLEMFQGIWRTMSYDKIGAEGPLSDPPPGVEGSPRAVFGKNGKGRFASFCFASKYTTASTRDGQRFDCEVSTSSTRPLVINNISFEADKQVGHGTEIVGTGDIRSHLFTEEQARELIGSRFLFNPAFKVSINGKAITFNDIPALLSQEDLEVPGYGTVKILHIDSKKPNKTTKQHGIAWWVQNRAVGQCKWSGSDYERILDGRTSEAKRFIFIVQADYLNQRGAVASDWSGFNDENPAWTETRTRVQDRIRQIISDTGEASKTALKTNVMTKLGNSINGLSLLSKERVQTFVAQVVDKLPSFGESEIVQLGSLLTNLEKSKSQFGLLELLHDQKPDDLDALHSILSDWSIGMAKLALDEIQTRLKLIGELRIKLKVVGIDEVHELQPLFERGLWMFGAQFESIEFTSNRGMTQVIKTIFGDKKGKGTRNRPDFVALPDSSIGFYARPSYNAQHDEDGVDHLVIIDLKTTGLSLGGKEQDQVWKYVKELRARGYLKKHSKVDCFVLGDAIEDGESEPTSKGDEVTIFPMLYETILNRAEKRLLNLHSKVKDAPFLLEQQEQLNEFLEPVPVVQPELAAVKA